MGNVLEYVIRATDATGQAISSAISRVKSFTANVASSMSSAKKNLDPGAVEEKFIRTTRVLDILGRALDRIGVSGEEFNDVYDVMKARLDDFNRTGEGFDDLLQHFRLSMDDVGMSAKHIDKGIEILKQNLTGFGTTGKEAANEMRGGFRAVHLAMGALNGNVYALGRAFTYVLGSIKKLKLSASMLTGISLAVYAITEVLTKCVEWWDNKKRKMQEIQDLRFEDTLKRYSERQNEVNKELSKHERQMDYEIERKKKLIDHNAKLIEQEIELARIKALEGTTGAERDAVNRDFDAQRSALKAKTAIQKAQADLEGSIASAEFISKLEAKLKPQKEMIEKQLADMDKQVTDREKKKRDEIDKSRKTWNSGMIGGAVITSSREWTDEEKKSIYEEWAASDEEYRKLKEKRDRLKEQYDGIIDDLDDFKQRKTKAIDKASDTKADISNIEQDFNIEVWRQYEQEMHEYYEQLERLQAEAARQAERDAEAQRRAEEKRHQERIKNAQDEFKRLEELQGEAEGRLNAAKNYSSQAWGFYKDRDSLNRHNADVDNDLAARKRYEKDFESLSSGRYADKFSELKRIARRDGTDAVEAQLAEWRKKKTISLDTEAAMRVGVADDQERLAYKYAEETAKNTAQMAASLKQITEGGAEE